MMKKLLIISILISLIACNNSARYEEESQNFLECVYSEYDITNCKFVIHPYGLFMDPLLDKNSLEEELSEYLGPNVWDRIKNQTELASKFTINIRLSENHISSKELTSFLNKVNDSDLNFWDEINQRYGCISEISIPIFSDDYNHVFIYEYTMFHGKAGGGKCIIYKYEDGEWKKKKKFNEWIS